MKVDNNNIKIIKLIKSRISKGDNVIDEIYAKSVIVLGKTGSGKSTLVNMMINYDSLVIKDIGYELRYDTNILDESIPVIGNTLESETSIPVKVLTPECIYWDCPGFADTKGPCQDIPNAYYIHKIFQSSIDTKIIIVINSADFFQTRYTEIQLLLKNLSNMFVNIDEIIDSFLFIINKTKKSDCRYDKILYILNSILNTSSITIDDKLIITTLINNPERIICIPEPENIHDKYDNFNLINQLATINYSKNVMTNKAISSDSILIINDLYNDEADIFTNKISMLCDQIINIYNINIVSLSINEIIKINKKWQETMSILNNLLTQNFTIHTFNNIDLFSSILPNYQDTYAYIFRECICHITFFTTFKKNNIDNLLNCCRQQLEILLSNIQANYVTFRTKIKHNISIQINSIIDDMCTGISNFFYKQLDSITINNFNKYPEIIVLINTCDNFNGRIETLLNYVDNDLIVNFTELIGIVENIICDSDYTNIIKNNFNTRITHLNNFGKITNVKINDINQIVYKNMTKMLSDLFTNIRLVVESNDLYPKVLNVLTIICREKIDNDILHKIKIIIKNFSNFDIIKCTPIIKALDGTVNIAKTIYSVTGIVNVLLDKINSKIINIYKTIKSEYTIYIEEIHRQSNIRLTTSLQTFKKLIIDKINNSSDRFIINDFFNNHRDTLFNSNINEGITIINKLINSSVDEELSIYAEISTNLKNVNDFAKKYNYDITMLQYTWQDIINNLYNHFSTDGKQKNNVTKQLRKLINRVNLFYTNKNDRLIIIIDNYNKMCSIFKSIQTLLSEPIDCNNIVEDLTKIIYLKDAYNINKISNYNIRYTSPELCTELKYLLNTANRKLAYYTEILENKYTPDNKLIKKLNVPPINSYSIGDILFIYGHVIIFKDIESLISNSHNTVIFNVMCTLIIDDDIIMHGKNLIILAPIVQINKSINIFLNGNDCKYVHPKPIISGIDGLPGEPGSNGGSFYLFTKNMNKIKIRCNTNNDTKNDTNKICTNEDKKQKYFRQQMNIVSKEFPQYNNKQINAEISKRWQKISRSSEIEIFINVNGGTGGVGGNGSNGESGTHGTNASITNFSKENISDITHVRLSGGDYNRIKTLYGFKGSAGKDGGKGGAGGIGGIPGKILIYCKKENIKNFNGSTLNGIDGNPGKGGIGGKYGNNLKCYVYNIHHIRHTSVISVEKYENNGNKPKTLNNCGIKNPIESSQLNNLVSASINQYLTNSVKYLDTVEYYQIYGDVIEEFIDILDQ